MSGSPDAPHTVAEIQQRRSTPAQVVGLGLLAVAVMSASMAAAWIIRGRARDMPAPKPSVLRQPVGGRPALSSFEKRGRLVYQVNCARCHGSEGHGNGPDAAALRPPPRDFAATHWHFDTSLETIRKVTRDGIPGTVMPGWSNTLSGTELDAVAAHVRTLNVTTGQPLASEAFEALLKTADFRPLRVDSLAPNITLEDFEGAVRRLADWQGTPTLLVLWGTACAPCVDELPALDRLASEWGNKGLAVVLVCVDESDPVAVRGVVENRLTRLKTYLSRDGMAQVRFDALSLPFAALIDHRGRLIANHSGRTNWDGDEVREFLRACVQAGASTGE